MNNSEKDIRQHNTPTVSSIPCEFKTITKQNNKQ